MGLSGDQIWKVEEILESRLLNIRDGNLGGLLWVLKLSPSQRVLIARGDSLSGTGNV